MVKRKLDARQLQVLNEPQFVHRLRYSTLKKAKIGSGPVLYWMSRDQRVKDNWALLYAQELALNLKRPLWVVFSLAPRFLKATLRQYTFMLKGLEEVGKTLNQHNIKFFVLSGDPAYEIPFFINRHDIAILVADFDPLKIKRHWKEKVQQNIDIDFYEVDAHNIVPAGIAGKKQEYGAHTFRPKILRLLPEFLTEFPTIKFHPYGSTVENKELVFNEMIKILKVDFSVWEIKWLKPGERAARDVLNEFLQKKLSEYHIYRNDPNKGYQSNLSPYLHFGQISAQRVAIEVLRQREINNQAKNAFLEELIVRRELSDNFCFFNPDYDAIDCAPGWARQTLKEHERDKRKVLYDLKAFEEGKTHDELWNACQKELVIKGKMHSYMRMYWAKKILEWTAGAKDALKIAIYLNDRYELDGRDPNGYAGIAWSICGVHDRPWRERPIFGKIRYMSSQGCARKFDVREYIKRVNELMAP